MVYLGLVKPVSLLSRSLKYCFGPRACIRKQAASDAPLISVVIATYNWSSVLRFAIHSVLWQSEQDFEILVVGDCCTDDSQAVCASFGDSRIRWHNLEKNSGHQSAPNNCGIKMARGHYVAFLGHDDVWHPEHLRVTLATLRSAECEMAVALMEMIGPEGSNYRVLSGYPEEVANPRAVLPPSGMLIRREALERSGGWSDYRTTSLNPGLDFLLRLRNTGSRMVATGELTVFKFNSALRKNSYRERPCHEQAAYVRCIERDRWFTLREAMRIIILRARRLPVHAPDFSQPPNADALGWEVSQFRKYRGLD
jgi:glycosyltransferase involved in cell wall biosynthesis